MLIEQEKFTMHELQMYKKGHMGHAWKRNICGVQVTNT